MAGYLAASRMPQDDSSFAKAWRKYGMASMWMASRYKTKKRGRKTRAQEMDAESDSLRRVTRSVLCRVQQYTSVTRTLHVPDYLISLPSLTPHALAAVACQAKEGRATSVGSATLDRTHQQTTHTHAHTHTRTHPSLQYRTPYCCYMRYSVSVNCPNYRARCRCWMQRSIPHSNPK